MISLSAVFFASMLMDCPAEPVRDGERQHILSIADKARSSSRENVDFESVTVSKCVARFDTNDDPPISGRSEHVSLYATFPHDIETDRYRERYAIRCSVSTDFIGDSETSKREHCLETHERFLRHDRLPEEVSLEGNISVDDAKAFLDHLIEYDLELDAKERLLKLLSGGGSVRVRERSGRLTFRFSTMIQGDTMMDVSADATRRPELKFHGIR